ncbi:MAG: ATP-binding protein [Saprospiraceae bacterium]|nr:ATP-binding protein [Saprospiraceae bacterium]
MLKVRSNPQNVAQLEPFLEEVLSSYKVTPDKYGEILVSLTEAVANAIIHGNCNDESKTVEVECRTKGNMVAFRVSDQGCGFDPNCIADPTCGENLVKIGGRGVFLMRELCDKLQFLNNGRTVEMKFKILSA